MSVKKKIYFAHPFSKMGTKREEMIIKILEERGFEVIDPFIGEDELCRKYGVSYYYQKPMLQFANEIVYRDFKMVDDCDALFAWLPKTSVCLGTVRELDRALRKGKETIVIHHKPNPFLIDVDILYLNYNDFKWDVPYKWKEK